MRRRRRLALCPMRTPEPTSVRAERGWTKTMDVVFQIAQVPSLCSLCLCVLCVQRKLPRHALRGIDVCCWKVVFDTEGTKAQRTQRNFRLSRPFDTSGRMGVDEASALGSKPPFAEL